MAKSNNVPPGGFKVEVYKIARYLRAKMGVRFKDQEAGYIAPEAVAEADQHIIHLCETSHEKITELLNGLAELWSAMKDMKDTPARAQISEQVFTQAHEIKDVGAMCGYDLIAYFAESLRDYIGQTKLSVDAQRVIIQAHMDAMQAVHRQGFKKEAGPEAEQLKKMVKVAIEKYS